MRRKQIIKKEIDLSGLPTKRGIRGNKNKIIIDWENSIGYKIRFIYDNIDDCIEIISYELKKSTLTVKYNNEDFNITTGNLKKCRFGKMLKKVTGSFKIEIGTRFKDEKRDITIIDRKKEQDKNGKWCKYYKYHCNICTFDCGNHYSTKNKIYKDELWIEESHLLTRKDGCSCCRGIAIVEDINSIYKIDSWIIPYIGEECAKIHSHGSKDKIYPICPDCGRIKDKKISIDNIYKMHSIGCPCSDKIPYPEKFMFSVLEQLGLDFQTQLNKNTYNWIIDDKRYDFYFKLNEEEYIIETHGMQHYEDCGWSKVKDVQENDKLKKTLALTNGIKEENYIIIDCRYSNLDFIKQNILDNNKLNELFDLSIINFNICNEYALSNLVKQACELWNNGIHNTNEIAMIMKLAQGTIIRYLNQGRDNYWCDYRLKNNKLITEKHLCHFKSVKVFKDDTFLGLFISISDVERKSEISFGVKLLSDGISQVCHGKRKDYKGYYFEFE